MIPKILIQTYFEIVPRPFEVNKTYGSDSPARVSNN